MKKSMETPSNFRQLKHKISKEKLIAEHDEELIDTLNKLIAAKDVVHQLKKEVEQLTKERDRYAALAGIKPKSPNAIRQAKYRSRKKAQSLDNKGNM